ncbi:GNAT family N-acetyltransferase [Niallia sp. FSL W8-0635]|uniref:GNAT family N-acetyltransferase n=1 Tax=Niallia sp. FSL W8-0635 TaxID=2975337 RepID=UPI0009C57FC1|nr:Acetyltransferase (GNAT) family [Mycobacteroides abscessus subsp. abscessus]HEO8421992.1 GNAT family N-acetyltransferase [Yersinia enterocolitica]
MLYRKFTANDFALYYQLVSDEQVMAQITERVIPVEEAKLNYEKLLYRNEKYHMFGSYSFFHRETKEFIGLGHLTLNEDKKEEVELGYMLLPEVWGKGYGSEIAEILMELAKQTNVKIVKAIIDPANFPSRKILINQGFTSVWIGEMDGLPGEVLRKELG